MSLNWKNFSKKDIEKHFNPRVAVPDFSKYIEDAQKKAKSARNILSSDLDIPYGKHPLQKLDIFYNKNLKNAPVHIFIHGGYWRALDKFDHSHLAAPFVKENCIYFSLNYGLCPSIKLSEIKNQIFEAIIWIYKNCSKYGGNPNNINISGHSAGAHLCAILTNFKWETINMPKNIIKSAFLISGIYEPEVVLKLSLNDEIGLTKKEASTNTPIPTKKITTHMFLSVGDSEPLAWIEQTKKYTKMLLEKDNSVNFKLLKNQNHFSILNLLSDPNTIYTKRMIEITKLE
tara:strand:+ start:6132 stop:6992 length:861 start_codon:yes stop_codon:yes gene_type:complete